MSGDGDARPARAQALSPSPRAARFSCASCGGEESLERVAAAVALGVGVGLSPFIGFHFFLAIALAWMLRLNKLDTVLGSIVGNPWTLPPFYALGYRIGRAILGFAPAHVPQLKWQRILHHDFWVSFRGPGSARGSPRSSWGPPCSRCSSPSARTSRCAAFSCCITGGIRGWRSGPRASGELEALPQRRGRRSARGADPLREV